MRRKTILNDSIIIDLNIEELNSKKAEALLNVIFSS